MVMLPVQSIRSEKTIGPLTDAGDCRAAGREKVAGDSVRFVTQVGHVPVGRKELSVAEAAR